MEKIPKIAILGGGVGGLVCASELNYRLGVKAQINVFDRSSYHIYQPAFLHLAFGQRKLNSIRRPLDRLNRQGINYLHGEVFRIDPKNMVINSENGDFEFDFFVVSLGAKLDASAVEGFEENALNLYTAEEAEAISEVLKDFTGGKIAIVISSMPYKCPAAPYEMAFLVDYFFRQKNLRQKVEITVVTPEPHPMPVAGLAVGQQVVGLLEQAQIKYMPNQSVKALGNFISLEKKRFKADLVIGIPPHRCPNVLVDAGLAKKGGWVQVNKRNLETKFENVYAIGDNTAIMLANGKPLPKAGVFAKSQAQVVAFNLAHKLTKNGVLSRSFEGNGSCFLEVGDKKAAFAKGGFYHEPDPLINLKSPSRFYYIFKMLYEKYWMRAWI